MSAAETGFRPSTEESPAEASSETGPREGSGSWPVRCALVAAASLVVGGIAYGAVEVAAAFSPADSTGSSEAAESEEREPEDSERRTVSLLPEDGQEETASTESTGRTEGFGVGQENPAGGEGASTGSPGAPDGGVTDPGSEVDPRREILEGILNSPQPRPPLEPLVTQEDVDAEREALEAEALRSQGDRHDG